MKKTYKVTANRRVFETEPGETFSAELTDEEEARHIERGTIEVAAGSSDRGTDDKKGGLTRG